MKKFLEWLTGGILKDVGSIVDDVVTTKEEKALIKERLQNMILDHALNSDKLRAAIVETEAKGNWLQRSWRPVTMLAFVFIVVYTKFLAPAFGLPSTELDENFWSLLNLGIGGYVIGRTVEKVAPNINLKKK